VVPLGGLGTAGRSEERWARKGSRLATRAPRSNVQPDYRSSQGDARADFHEHPPGQGDGNAAVARFRELGGTAGYRAREKSGRTVKPASIGLPDRFSLIVTPAMPIS